jgi:tRNA-Thr(GGU) m(6)t(6)A37 methyltransferase TsaA
MKHIITPIGHIHSCFNEKFGTPRQSLLVSNSYASIELMPPYNHHQAWIGIEDFSHLWLFFIFHKSLDKKNMLTARPPRLGGEKKLGIFATRSPYRPNGIGQSIVKLERVNLKNAKVTLEISGHDILDGTPLVDIKPYIPQYDIHPNASSGWVNKYEYRPLEITFLPLAQKKLEKIPQTKGLIKQMISLDPRPAHQRDNQQSKEYKMRVSNYDVIWKVEQQKAYIINIITL